MTKSDEFIGKERSFVPAESLTIQVPEIKSQTTIHITHNTSTGVDMTNTQTTLATINWKEPSDFIIKSRIIPTSGKAYADNGSTITATIYSNGTIVCAGYTTAIVSPCWLSKTLVFSAGKYKSVKRIMFLPGTFSYKVAITFTDIAGGSRSCDFYVRPNTKSRSIDVRKYQVDRSLAMTVTYSLYYNLDAVLGDNGLISNPNLTFFSLDDPVEMIVDCYNSLDLMSFSSPPLVDNGVKSQLRTYFENYKSFLELDARSFSVPLDSWIDALATSAAYSIGQAWRTSEEFNDLSEVRNLSLTLSGCMSKISSGTFINEVYIPEHFSDAISNFLAGNQGNFTNLMLLAAIWALADEMVIENNIV